MFWKKKRGLEPVLDGVKHVQLYVCPSCGKRVEKKSLTKCEVCGVTVCEERFSFSNHCSRVIILDFRNHIASQHEFYFCNKHYKLIEKGLKKLINSGAKDE